MVFVVVELPGDNGAARLRDGRTGSGRDGASGPGDCSTGRTGAGDGGIGAVAPRASTTTTGTSTPAL
jgi:hypothetical protein